MMASQQDKSKSKDVSPGGNIQTVQSLSRGIEMFEYVLAASYPVRIVDVAAHFEIDKSVAYRFLATLERHGLLEKDPDRKTYTVGPRLSAWSKKLGDGRAEMLARIKPLVENLAMETGQTAHIAVLESDRVLLIEVSAADTPVGIRQKAGDLEPLYCSAVGKAILAWLPEPAREALIAEMQFSRLTPHTITTKKALQAELADVRKTGVAFDRCEGNLEVCCVAAPIFDLDDGVVASIGVSMPRRLLDGGPDEQHETIRSVVGAAEVARKTLFGPATKRAAAL